MFNSLLFNTSMSPGIFDANTLALSVLTVSTFGFFILFSVMTFIFYRRDIIKELEEIMPKQNIEDLLFEDFPLYWFLEIFGNPKIIANFILTSLLYIFVLRLCLINYFIESVILLYINIGAVLLITCFLFSVIGKSYIKLMLTYTALQWLRKTNQS